MAKYSPYQLACLKQDIEIKFNRTFKSPSDFDTLVLAIKECSDGSLNASTLKRLWGYSKYDNTPRLSTLTVLARVLGYVDWDAYVVDLVRKSRVESGFLSSESIVPSRLCVGDKIYFTWKPDREATIVYRGEGVFEVEVQKNSKLLPGDRFSTNLLRVGAPLYCTDFHRGDEAMPTYVAGEQNGITSLSQQPIPNKESGPTTR